VHVFSNSLPGKVIWLKPELRVPSQLVKRRFPLSFLKRKTKNLHSAQYQHMLILKLRESPRFWELLDSI
jgi:hypothetical protein